MTDQLNLRALSKHSSLVHTLLHSAMIIQLFAHHFEGFWIQWRKKKVNAHIFSKAYTGDQVVIDIFRLL